MDETVNAQRGHGQHEWQNGTDSVEEVSVAYMDFEEVLPQFLHH